MLWIIGAALAAETFGERVRSPVSHGEVAEVHGACLDTAPAWRAAATVAASSSLEEGALRYLPAHTRDDSHRSAWCEGVEGHGVGEWIEYRFDEPVQIEAVHLFGGYFLDARRLESNNRLKKVRLEADGYAPLEVTLADPAAPTPGWQPPASDPERSWFAQAQQWPAFLYTEIQTQRLRITVLEVHPGSKHSDTCISEIRFTGADEACLRRLEAE